MRWGELIGLQRKNLDVVNRRVRVVEQLVRTQDGKFHRKAPKTSAGVRLSAPPESRRWWGVAPELSRR